MLTPIGNYHHSKLPSLGAIVIVRTRDLAPKCRWRRWIVESFPLTDSPDPRYSVGIHTVVLRALDNGCRLRVAGHFCEVQS